MYLCIPSGQRPEKLEATLKAWKRYSRIHVVGYAWDELSAEVFKRHGATVFEGERKSFAILQNYLARQLPLDWHIMICGADDLRPGIGITRIRKLFKHANGNVLWVFDGINASINTHPIITVGWWLRNNRTIFDEQFQHNYCDSDLMTRTIQSNRLIKVEGTGMIHDHPLSVPLKDRDVVYQLGYASHRTDKKLFRMKHSCLGKTIIQSNLSRIPIISV